MSDLVKKLRSTLSNEPSDDALWERVIAERQDAADEIERLAAEAVRLREALAKGVYEATHLSPQEPDGSHWAKMSAEWLAEARAALKKESTP